MIGRILLLALALAPMRFAAAQPPPPGPPPHETPPPPVRPGPPPAVERFFEFIRQQDPEDYERLHRLRETNRAAFRAEIAERIRRERDRRGLPEFHEGPPFAWNAGPCGERKHHGPRGGRPDGAAMRIHSPELEALERRARELARAVREAETEEHRDQAEAELRDVLGRAFDLREQLRRERLQQMRAHLDAIEKFLAERAANRDAIIERRLRRLTDAPEMEW
jgi:hypothetical protein